VIVTLDFDFHELLAASHSTELSVIRIGVEGLKGDALALVVLR
jgi:predicted nuclease of predicted toxin-antitoxin system